MLMYRTCKKSLRTCRKWDISWRGGYSESTVLTVTSVESEIHGHVTEITYAILRCFRYETSPLQSQYNTLLVHILHNHTPNINKQGIHTKYMR
jgi:hypothetical protein